MSVVEKKYAAALIAKRKRIKKSYFLIIFSIEIKSTKSEQTIRIYYTVYYSVWSLVQSGLSLKTETIL